jgi:hypothetical protein
MGDLIFVAVVVAFFGLAVAYVRGCERIIGRDPGVEAVPDTDTEDASRAFVGTPVRRR